MSVPGEGGLRLLAAVALLAVALVTVLVRAESTAARHALVAGEDALEDCARRRQALVAELPRELRQLTAELDAAEFDS